MSGQLHVVWYKRDLRMRDHMPLISANTAGTVLPLYIIQPQIIYAPDFDARHWDFIRTSLHELRDNLAKHRTTLVVRLGNPTEVLHHLHCSVGIAALYSHRETGNLASYAIDKSVSKWAFDHGIPWHEFDQNGVIRKLRTRTGWAHLWEKRMSAPQAGDFNRLHPPHRIQPGEIPTSEFLKIPALGGQKFQQGGEDAAWRVLESFLESRGANYSRSLSSPLTAWEGCSRLSTHLSWGTISLRSVVQSARQRLLQLRELRSLGRKEPFRLSSLSSFISRLHWRCHFMQKLEDFPEMEIKNLWSAADGLRPQIPDERNLHAWRKGQTGYPFFDACLRAVHATGWMNFRMRAMMMSFAAYDLWMHWREPALHLARCFLDYEPGIHWPQSQMQSGTTGINTLRIYDPVKQGLEHDPTGDFTRRWVPELAKVPLAYLHRPWLMGSLQAQECGVLLGKNYPHRIVDHAAAVREAKEKLYALRKKPHAKELANAIQEKHGSRKSGLKQITRKKNMRTNNVILQQPSLFDLV